MATIICHGLRNSQKTKIPRQDLLSQIGRIEKRNFARNEVFDFSAEVVKRNLELFVIVNDGDGPAPGLAVVAYMVIVHNKIEHIINLHKICVEVSFRRQGIGRRLLALCLEKLSRQGASTIYLWVHEANVPAKLLYEDAGFKEVAKLGDYYARGRTGVQMVMSLI